MDLSHFVQTESTTEIIKWHKTITKSANFKELNYSLLCNSIKYKKLDLVMILLESNCNLNRTTESEMPANTPLHYAVIMGNYELVEDLLKRQASLFAVNSEGNTPLHLAFIFKKEKIIDLLLKTIKQVSNYNNFKNNEGLTHLHIASTRLGTSILKNYLKTEVGVEDAVSKNSLMWAGYTALHFAVKYNSLAAVKLLLKYNASLDTKDNNVQTPLQLANEHLVEPSIIVDILSRYNTSYCDTMTHFHIECLNKDPSHVESYIKKGMDVNLTIHPQADFCPGYTPLHFAVVGNCKDTVISLLEYGADTGRVNKNGMTPAHLAFYKDTPRSLDDMRNKSIFKRLFAKLDDKLRDCKDSNGLSYFHMACATEDLDNVKQFLDTGRDVNERVSLGNHVFSGFTPLHFAVLYQQNKVAELLMNYGSDVNAYDDGKRGTPLHLALEKYSNDIARPLIEEGANVTAIRPNGNKTTLHLTVESLLYACKHRRAIVLCWTIGRLRMIETLTTELGVDIDAKDKDGNTVLHYVCLNIKHSRLCLKKLLDLGANINVENYANRTPFEECMKLDKENRGDVHEYATLYHHVQSLKALGLEVNLKNEKCCEKLMKKSIYWFDGHKDFETETLVNMEKKRLDEIERMKSTMVDADKSLYEFALIDEKNGIGYVNNDFLKQFVDYENSSKEYPSFGYLVRVKYLKAVFNQKKNSAASLKRSASATTMEGNSAKLQRLE